MQRARFSLPLCHLRRTSPHCKTRDPNAACTIGTGDAADGKQASRHGA